MSSTSAERIRVLHVNDELDFADLTATFLERESDRFDVGTATSAEEGMEILASQGLDCIVSDYDMPGTNGIEFLEAVRDQHPELPFILYTGKGSEEVAGEAISAGVTDYIQKKSGTDQYLLLANRIENAVTKHWTQQTAERRKERFEMFFEESPIGAVQWDENLRFERVNERAEEILGYTEAELRGEPWQSVVVESDRDRIGDAARQLLSAGGGRHVVSKNVRKDGEIRQCEWHNRAVTDGDGETWLLFSKFQDITDHEWRKAELERYETIVEALGDAVYVLDEEGRFTHVNDEFVELVGYDREMILGSRPSLVKDDDAVERAERHLGRLLSRDGPETIRFEVAVHPRIGDPVVCQEHVGVLSSEGERFNGSVGVLREVPERAAREREREAARR